MSDYNDEECEPTVVAAEDFDAEQDCDALKGAMQGFGCDKKTVIDIVGKRSNKQRQQIKADFKTMFGKDLADNMGSELHGKFEDVILALFMTPEEYDASELRKAMKGAGTDNDCLIEIMCTRNNEQIAAIRDAYTRLYDRNLEEDLVSDTDGTFKHLIVASVQANREEEEEVDEDRAKQDAQDLFNAGIATWGTDESEFHSILAKRSMPHLRAVFTEYLNLSGRSLDSDIRQEMSGCFGDGLLTIVAVVQNRVGHYADKLYNAMHGLGTDDESLIRVVVTRCEIDMVQIKKAFFDKYEETLYDMIKSDTRGDYEDILLTLVGTGPDD